MAIRFWRLNDRKWYTISWSYVKIAVKCSVGRCAGCRWGASFAWCVGWLTQGKRWRVFVYSGRSLSELYEWCGVTGGGKYGTVESYIDSVGIGLAWSGLVYIHRLCTSHATRSLHTQLCLFWNSQIWILIAVCTLSALPWMMIEFKKADFSVHYQGMFWFSLYSWRMTRVWGSFIHNNLLWIIW